MAAAWSPEEVDRTIDVYFQMLALELGGETYSKAVFRRELLTEVDRSPGAVEYKLQNVSAVLAEIGAVFIDGYKPARNVQNLLRQRVLERFDDAEDLRHLMLHAVRAPVHQASVDLTEPAAVPKVPARDERDIEVRVRTGRHADYQRIEALNRDLGLAGERAVVKRECGRLEALGRRDLAERVRHVAVEDGDGLGYDVLSFDAGGRERFLEVKTTRYSSHQPFMVTRNEVVFSSEESERFALVRLFKFEAAGCGFYELPGALRETAHLDPLLFSGVPRVAS